MRDESIVVTGRILPSEDKEKAFELFQRAIRNPDSVNRQELLRVWGILRPFRHMIHRDDRKKMRQAMKLRTDDHSVDELPIDEAFAAGDSL